MAKNKQPEPSSRGKMRVFFAEFEGDDMTIQEGLRAIAAAVNKTFQQPTLPRAQLLTALPALESEFNEVPEEVLENQDEDGLEPEPSGNASPRQTRNGKRKPPSMSLIKEMDLHPSGKQSLREFFGEKQPKTQFEQIAVFVFYMRSVLEIDGISPNHIYTCFKDVSAKPPVDVPQVARNCAAQKGWIDTSRKEGIDITTRGENLIDHDLPRDGAVA